MHFAKFASSLLTAAALLSSSVTASPTKSPAIIARDEATDALNAQCDRAGTAAKMFRRDSGLMARASVTIGEAIPGAPGTTLETIGIATCQGIAVSGKYDDKDTKGDTIFLAHVGAMDASPIGTIVSLVKDAQGKGLKDIKITVVYCDPDSLPEEQAFLGDTLSDLNDKLFDAIDDIDDADVSEKKIKWEETASLSIGTDGKISFSKRVIPGS